MKRVFGVVLVVTSCMSSPEPRRSEPVMKAAYVPANDEERRGQRVYMARCNGCHPGGDSALGPALNNKPLLKGAIAAQVRAGVGAMPSFNDQELSEEDLNALTTYVVALRKHD